MAQRLLPSVKSMILCKDVLPGPEGTGNVQLMNVFSEIRPQGEPAFPYRLPELCVFLQLTDAEGQIHGRVVACQADSGEIAFSSKDHLIHFRDRLQVKWVLFRIKDCPFPEPGLYWKEFHCGGRWLADQTVTLLG
jgi:hypothetical protein